MADTRISKLKVRRGQLTDMPVLEEGELGYATDAYRLFIGNSTFTVGTGDDTTTVFVLPLDTDNPATNLYNPTVYVDGVLVNPSTYTIVSTTLTFDTAPVLNSVITIRWNSEIILKTNVAEPSSLTLDASSAAGTNTGLAFDKRIYDTAFIEYSLKLSDNSAYRVGNLRILVDPLTDNVVVDDQFNITSTINFVFDASVTGNILNLTYENTETLPVIFKFTYKLWKM